jgi:hypothetical protein
MMKHFIQLSLLVLGLLLLACQKEGENSFSTSTTRFVSTHTLSGKAIDGYLSGAEVFLDLNNNQTHDSNEPSTTTSQTGDYTLTLTHELNSSVTILVLGGVDSVSGDAFTGILQSRSDEIDAEGKIHISPLTTLVANLRDIGETQKSAKNKIATLMSVNSSDLNGDGVALFETKPEIYKAGQKIIKLIQSIQKNDSAIKESDIITALTNSANDSNTFDTLSELNISRTTLSITTTIATIKEEVNDIVTATQSNPTIIQTVLKGRGIDGHLVGTRVFLDANKNSQYDNGEYSTLLGADSNYSLLIKSVGELNSSLKLVALGGKNSSIDADFNGVISTQIDDKDSNGHLNLSYLTTLTTLLRDKGNSLNSAKSRVASTLNIQSSQLNQDLITLFSSDPLPYQMATLIRGIIDTGTSISTITTAIQNHKTIAEIATQDLITTALSIESTTNEYLKGDDLLSPQERLAKACPSGLKGATGYSQLPECLYGKWITMGSYDYQTNGPRITDVNGTFYYKDWEVLDVNTFRTTTEIAQSSGGGDTKTTYLRSGVIDTQVTGQVIDKTKTTQAISDIGDITVILKNLKDSTKTVKTTPNTKGELKISNYILPSGDYSVSINNGQNETSFEMKMDKGVENLGEILLTNSGVKLGQFSVFASNSQLIDQASQKIIYIRQPLYLHYVKDDMDFQRAYMIFENHSYSKESTYTATSNDSVLEYFSFHFTNTASRSGNTYEPHAYMGFRFNHFEGDKYTFDLNVMVSDPELDENVSYTIPLTVYKKMFNLNINRDETTGKNGDILAYVQSGDDLITLSFDDYNSYSNTLAPREVYVPLPLINDRNYTLMMVNNRVKDDGHKYAIGVGVTPSLTPDELNSSNDIASDINEPDTTLKEATVIKYGETLLNYVTFPDIDTILIDMSHVE